MSGRRLVTVLGPGGVGKTSLALGVISETTALAAEVRICELADVLTPDAVRPAIAARLGLLLHPGTPIGRSLPADGPALLVLLDNCEHVLDAAADAAAELLSAGPQVRVLATSREPLGCPPNT